jgi:hypothetical protein
MKWLSPARYPEVIALVHDTAINEAVEVDIHAPRPAFSLSSGCPEARNMDPRSASNVDPSIA